MRRCKVEDCMQPSRARQMCTRHYQRWYAHRDPQYVAPTLAEQGLIPHGTPQAYNFHKCRCETCMAWKRPYMRKQMLAKYGLTPADFDRMVADQGGVCAACCQPSERTLQVDHCHATGRVRGLLCGPCNRAVGLLKDDPDRAIALASYLMHPSSDDAADCPPACDSGHLRTGFCAFTPAGSES